MRKYVESRAGCHLATTGPEYETCKTREQMQSFHSALASLNKLSWPQLVKVTGCLAKCKHTEFSFQKVRTYWVITNLKYNYRYQIIISTLCTDKRGKNHVEGKILLLFFLISGQNLDKDRGRIAGIWFWGSRQWSGRCSGPLPWVVNPAHQQSLFSLYKTHL